MPTFVYKAITKQGLVVKNKVTEMSRMSCIEKLKRNEMIPISVVQTFSFSRAKTEKKTRNFKDMKSASKKIGREKLSVKQTDAASMRERFIRRVDRMKKISFRDVRIFTQSFYLLKKANFNNVHALTTVMDSTENPKLRIVIEDILYGIESGEFMHTTMEYYSDVFPYLYTNMIKVGELSGSLDIALGQAIKYLDETEKLRTKLRRILIPNIGMFIGIMIMLLVCVIVGVPAIQGIFDSIGTKDQLPAITLWFAGVVDVLMQFWYIPLMAIAAAVGGFFFYINTPIGRYRFDTFKYNMPIFGKLIYLIDFSRLLKNMLLNIQNGIRIQDALDVSKNVVSNVVMRSMIERAINNLFVGESWIEPFDEARFSNPMTVEMLNIGMKTDLEEMMEKLIEYMDIDIDNTLEKIMKVLPELSYAIVGIVLIFFVVVVLVPCIQIYMGGFLFSAYGF